MLTIGVPLSPSHDQFLFKLLSSLSLDKKVIQEIIISRSDVRAFEVPLFRIYAKVLSIVFSVKVTILSSPKFCNAATNRNRILKHCKSDYLLFLDADDIYIPDIATRLLCLIQEHQADLALFCFLDENECQPQHKNCTYDIWQEYLYKEDLSESQVLTQADLFKVNFPHGQWNKNREYGINGDTSIILPSGTSELFKPQHGCLIINCNTTDQIFYDQSLDHGEDGRFAKDLLFQQKKVVITSQKLMIYRHSLTWGRVPTAKRRLKHLISRIRKLFV